jgi:hypothetical protein
MSKGIASQASAKRIAACDHVWVSTFSESWEACGRACGGMRNISPKFYAVPKPLDLRRRPAKPRRKKISLKKQWQDLQSGTSANAASDSVSGPHDAKGK